MRIAALKILNEHDIGVAGEFLFILGWLWGTPALIKELGLKPRPSGRLCAKLKVAS